MPLLPVALYTALAFLFGLWQVGWSLERLPLWFYAYALYGFRLIPAQSGKRRLCIHIAESVFFPTRIRSD